jgi:pimeloyl-ACP methyl ester carboxylesterase
MARLEAATGRYCYLTVQGIEYRVYFEENGQGVPLICQHTAGGDGRQWRHLLNDPDVTAEYRVIVPDLPYHGKSLPPESVEWWKVEYKLTKSFFIDFFLEFSHSLGLDRPTFIGCSMGGNLALDLALECPAQFKAVIGLEGAEYTPGLDIIWFNHPRISGEFKFANLYESTAPGGPENYRHEIGWVYSQSAPSVFSGDLHYYSVEHNVTGQLGKIDTSRIGVYLLCGEYDFASTPEMCQQAASQIKGAKYCKMEGLGHFPISENYQLCKRYLMPVLDEIAKMK